MFCCCCISQPRLILHIPFTKRNLILIAKDICFSLTQTKPGMGVQFRAAGKGQLKTG